MQTLLAVPCLSHGRWLHTKRNLYGELTTGKRGTGHPKLRLNDMCKWDMKALDIDTDTWEDLLSWRSTLHEKLQAGKEKLGEAAAVQQASRKEAEENRIALL